MSKENNLENKDSTATFGNTMLGEVKHFLEYCMYSTKVSWCPICRKHFYNERNEKHTTKPTKEHYHLL